MITLKNGENAGTLEHQFSIIAKALSLRMNLRYLKQEYARDTTSISPGNKGHYDHQHVKKVADALGKPDLVKLVNVEEIHALADIRIAATLKTVSEAVKTLSERYGLVCEDGDIVNQYEAESR